MRLPASEAFLYAGWMLPSAPGFCGDAVPVFVFVKRSRGGDPSPVL